MRLRPRGQLVASLAFRSSEPPLTARSHASGCPTGSTQALHRLRPASANPPPAVLWAALAGHAGLVSHIARWLLVARAANAALGEGRANRLIKCARRVHEELAVGVSAKGAMPPDESERRAAAEDVVDVNRPGVVAPQQHPRQLKSESNAARLVPGKALADGGEGERELQRCREPPVLWGAWRPCREVEAE